MARFAIPSRPSEVQALEAFIEQQKMAKARQSGTFEAALQQVKEAVQQEEVEEPMEAAQHQDKPYVCGRCQHRFKKNLDADRSAWRGQSL